MTNFLSLIFSLEITFYLLLFHCGYVMEMQASVFPFAKQNCLTRKMFFDPRSFRGHTLAKFKRNWMERGYRDRF